LPLVFAGLVWPARRIWVVRLTELLVGLILSKFVIVAVLSLAGAALGGEGGTAGTRLLTAMALILLSTFAPWAMLRMLPFTELAAGIGDTLSNHARRLGNPVRLPEAVVGDALDLALALPGLLGRDLDRAGAATGADGGATILASRVAGGGGGGGRASEPETDDAGWEAIDAGADDTTRAEPEPGADAPEPGADTPEPGADEPEPPERRPGAAPIWQAANWEWPPTRLGADGWDGPTAFERHDDGDGSQ